MSAIEPTASVYDKNGRPILLGDVLKVYHFTGARRKRHFMYKYVSGIRPSGKAFVVDHLEPNSLPYFLLLDGKIKQDYEIVQGYAGVSGGQDFSARKKKETP